MWKPFQDDAEPPKWIRQRRTPLRIPGKVSVTAVINGWRLGQNVTFERVKRACAEFGDEVLFHPIDTADRTVLPEWGVFDDPFFDGKPNRFRPARRSPTKRPGN